MALLRVIAGEHQGKVYPLETDKLVLGRESNEIPVLDHGVSRQHAEFFRIGELFLVRDLDSRNGTFVNGEKVDEWVLRAGDRVQVGNTQLVFEDKFSGQSDSRVIKFTPTAEKPGATMSIPLPKSDTPDPDEEHARLKLFHRISNILGTGENLEQTMQKVARTLGVLLRADHLYVFSFEDVAEHEDFRFVAGFDKSEVEEIAVSKTILQRVRDEGLPLLSSDAMLDDRFSTSDSVVVQQIKSLLCVPLIVMNKPIGALYATNSKLSEVFSPEDLEITTQVGMLVGNSLEMWRRIEEHGRVYRSVLKMLAELSERHDPAGRGRAERVATYSAAVASALDDPQISVRNAWIAGLLHDIGAIGLTKEELEKAVNADQRKQRIASELLEKLPDLKAVAPAIARHTERLDGSGFPDGLRGEEQIPLLAQVVGVAHELDELLTSGSDMGGELPTKMALERIQDLAPAKFSKRVCDAVLVAYRLNRLFETDDAVFRAQI